VRDTIARQSDVDKDSIKYDVEPGNAKYRNGTITFAAKKGKSIDLYALHTNLLMTRLGKGTRSAVNYLDITAEGEVVQHNKDMRLKVSGTHQQFTLGEDPKAKAKEGTKTPFQRLREVLATGDKVVSVTGRVQGWAGTWPATLKEIEQKRLKDNELAPEKRTPTLLMVMDFEIAKK
jgi:hypothetical protein